jgi:hypothetical protein
VPRSVYIGPLDMMCGPKTDRLSSFESCAVVDTWYNNKWKTMQHALDRQGKKCGGDKWYISIFFVYNKKKVGMGKASGQG